MASRGCGKGIIRKDFILIPELWILIPLAVTLLLKILHWFPMWCRVEMRVLTLAYNTALDLTSLPDLISFPLALPCSLYSQPH